MKTKESIDINSHAKARRELLEYERENQDLDRMTHEREATKRIREEKIREAYKNIEDFGGDPWKIPDLPLLDVWKMREWVWPGLIRAGAIPKSKLIQGHTYLGSCRNSTKATWEGDHFTYTRHKFGTSYEEDINHFQDDDGSDLFIPIKDITNE